jgi:hypothetical protein
MITTTTYFSLKITTLCSPTSALSKKKKTFGLSIINKTAVRTKLYPIILLVPAGTLLLPPHNSPSTYPAPVPFRAPPSASNTLSSTPTPGRNRTRHTAASASFRRLKEPEERVPPAETYRGVPRVRFPTYEPRDFDRFEELRGGYLAGGCAEADKDLLARVLVLFVRVEEEGTNRDAEEEGLHVEFEEFPGLF